MADCTCWWTIVTRDSCGTHSGLTRYGTKNMTITYTDEVTQKFSGIAHDAQALTSLLERLAGRYMASDDVDLHRALHLAVQIAGTAETGLQPQAAPAADKPLIDAEPGPDGFFAMPGATSIFGSIAAVLSSPANEATPEDRRRFHAILVELLDAAREGGMPEGHVDELDSLALAGKLGGRYVALASEAVRCAGDHFCLATALRHGI